MFEPISGGVVAERYQLIEEIGRGSMGVVWRARQVNLRRDCAVKFIHTSQAHDAELRQRFVREARAAARLRSPHTVQVLDVNEWQGSLFIAMELLNGESLESRLDREGRLSPILTLEILTQVARGLDEAHAAQLVHRDLKPENIFLATGRPLVAKIVDFGIAKQMDASGGMLTALGTILGTPAYMSPEQADGGKRVDYRSDLWSLGIVAFRCLTGSGVFDATGLGQLLMQVLRAPIPAPSSRNPRLSPAVDAWCLSVLQRDPALRPASASALVAGLRQALEVAPPARAAEQRLRVSTSKRLSAAQEAAARAAAAAKQATLALLSASRGALPVKARVFVASLAFAVLGGAAMLWAWGWTSSVSRPVESAVSAERPRLPVPAPAASSAAAGSDSTRPNTPPAATMKPARQEPPAPSASPPPATKPSPNIKLLVSDPPPAVEKPRSAPLPRPGSTEPAASERPAADDGR